MDLEQHRTALDEPAGTVLIAHGYAEHSGRYGALVDALVGAGYDVVTHDFAGHGAAPGPRARVDVGRLITEHLDVRRAALEQARTPDLFLFGHSMGGLVTIASTLLDGDHVRATVVTGPALRPLPRMAPRVARALLPQARLTPWLPTVRLDSHLISRDPDVVRAYEGDPLVHTGPVPLLTGVTMVVQGDQVIRNAAMLTVPMLILHGGEDQLADLEGSREFIERTREAEVNLRVIDGAYHEVLNEPEGPALIQDIVSWIGSHR